MELLTLTDHFRYFLIQRPAISPGRLAEELGIDLSNLQKIIKGKRQIPQARRGDFMRIMEKYGYFLHSLEEYPGDKANPIAK